MASNEIRLALTSANENVSEKEIIVMMDENEKVSPKQRSPMQGAVFKGRFESETYHRIAVKRYLCDKEKEDYMKCIDRARNNLEFLSLLGNTHPNLIIYYGHQGTHDDTFIYLCTELCKYSVNQLITNPSQIIEEKERQGIFQVLPHKAILKQSTEAVNFLHGLGLVHRNLHPNNFLLQWIGSIKTEMGGSINKYAVKLTDFHLAKDWEKDSAESNRHPMNGWRAVPECKPEKDGRIRKERDSKSDVFTLGSYFYFVLSGGKHPFGTPGHESVYNENSPPFKNDWTPSDMNWTEEGARKALDLIRNMIRYLPSDRKSMWEVLDSDYFQKETSHYQIYDDIENRKPGLCVIICQEKFHDPLNDMDGMSKNCAQLRRTFFRFGYEVLVYKNIESQQMIDGLKPGNLAKVSKEGSLSKYASLVVCILSHGGRILIEGDKFAEEVVYGVDAGPVKTEPLIMEYNNFNCEELAGKPKVFIIFSCRGDKDQVVMRSSPAAPSLYSMPHQPTQDGAVVSVIGDDDTKSAMEDFLILRSTVIDFISYFTPGNGSSFIAHLCGALISEYNEKDLQISKDRKKDLVGLFHSYVVPLIGRDLIDVRSADGSTLRQTPESRSTLTKTIRFLPQVSTSDVASWITAEKENLSVQCNGIDELKFWKERDTILKQRLDEFKKDIDKLLLDIGKAYRESNVDEYNKLLAMKCEKEQEKFVKIESKQQEVLEMLTKLSSKGSPDGPCE